MSKLQDFLNNNTPTKFYKIIKRYQLSFGKYKFEIRILRDE